MAFYELPVSYKCLMSAALVGKWKEPDLLPSGQFFMFLTEASKG